MIDSDALKQCLSSFKNRQTTYADLHGRMQLTENVYANRLRIPLPDMNRSEEPSTPNLIAQAIDQLGGRVGSVIPSPHFVSVKPGQRTADRNARASEATISGWQELDHISLWLKQRGRDLVAHAMTPVVMQWLEKEHRPHWDVRKPLTCYPSTDLIPGQVVPSDVFFSYSRTLGELVSKGYQTQLYRLMGSDQHSMDTRISLLEYYNDEHCCIMACGSFNGPQMYPDAMVSNVGAVQLEMYEHGLGMTPVTTPVRMTLGAIRGQFDSMLGIYLRQAKLMALEEIGIERGLFPEVWIETHPGAAQQAKIVGEVINDGRSGLPNYVKDGSVKYIQEQPSYMAPQAIDRYERAMRVTGSIPAEMGGESSTNIRTGKRGDAVISAAIDFPIAEAQDILATAIQAENRLAIKLAKKYDGSASRTIYVGPGNARKPVTYVANETFGTEEHVVTYPVMGMDANTLVVSGSQRLGIGTLSKRAFMSIDPWVTDPETIHDEIISEGLESALMSSFQQQAASGQMPPVVVAKVMKLVATDQMELAEAIEKALADAQAEQQAQQQQPPDAPQTPDQLAAGPTQAALAGVQPPAQTLPGLRNLGDLLSQTRRPSMSIVPNRNAAQGAA